MFAGCLCDLAGVENLKYVAFVNTVFFIYGKGVRGLVLILKQYQNVNILLLKMNQFFC